MASKKSKKVAPEVPYDNDPPQINVAPTRKKYARREPEKFTILPELMSDEARMKYNVLLAILLREGGKVSFTGKDLEFDDQSYNVVYALSLDGTKLEIQVVNSQSGILKTSVAKPEPTNWPQQQLIEVAARNVFAPPPPTNWPQQQLIEVAARNVFAPPPPIPITSMPPPPKTDSTTSPPSSAFLSTEGPTTGTSTLNLNDLIASLETSAKESQIEAEQASASEREN